MSATLATMSRGTTHFRVFSHSLVYHDQSNAALANAVSNSATPDEAFT